MASTSPFTIETPSNSLRLDVGRTAQARFTVYNASGRAQRARAMIVAEPPAAREWLTLAGDEYRQFPVAGTESYAVDIAVPPEAAAGNYTLRLDVQGEDVPDRSHVQGPTVTFEVPAVVPPPPPPRFPWWVAAVIGLMVVAAIAFFLLRPRTVLVPDTNELLLDDAIVRLREAGLDFGQLLLQTSSSVPEASVISSDPPAGETVPRGSQVALTVSTGRGPIVCVRFPCNPWADILDERVSEAIEFQLAPNGVPQPNIDRELLQGLEPGQGRELAPEVR